ncbi:hypothetical protein X777_01635 [Ooceraea biroi]|uniref:Uncharacterized protein n=1 Tax=Ooceraea biroi TaxID=2015173 RepID=A0A026WPL1_OOCBI|nr:hypothetical protein X777_01635 [Ooceraea biroi]
MMSGRGSARNPRNPENVLSPSSPRDPLVRGVFIPFQQHGTARRVYSCNITNVIAMLEP